MAKFGCFLVTITTTVVGLAAAWYIRRTTESQSEDRQEEISEPVFNGTDVDSGLSGRLASLIVGGHFPSDQLDLGAHKLAKKTLEERAVELAREKLKNNPADAKAEARELLATVKGPHPCVFFLDLNNVIDDDDFLDNVPEEMQQEFLLQNMADFSALAAAFQC